MKLATCLLCSLLLASTAHAVEGWQEQVSAATGDQAQTQAVEVRAGSYFFEPNRITVKANTPVELRVRKAPGMAPHNFVIDAPQAGVQVKEELGTEPITIRATFSAPGEYPFFCGKKPPFLKAHRARGMEGTIVVTE